MAADHNKRSSRRFLAFGLGLSFLVLLEAALRLSGAAGPDKPIREIFFHPGRVYKNENGVFRTSSDYTKYFLDQRFPAKKAGAKRIFVTGGSAAMGFPLESILGPAGMLRIGLGGPGGGGYEIINAGAFGCSSFRVAEVVEEILGYDPDAVVVMSGHNEFLEWRFKNPGPGVKGRLSRLRLYRVLAGLVSAVRGGQREVRWEAHAVSDGERRLVLADFRNNLQRIARLCSEAGVPLVLVTCPSNIQDYRPYGPSPVPAKEKIDRAWTGAAADTGGFDTALSLLDPWEEEFPDDAWVLFERASIYRGRARHLRSVRPLPPVNGQSKGLGGDDIVALLDQANRLFARARDADPVPVRAVSGINAIVREVAKESGAYLADAQKRIASLRDGFDYSDAFYFFDHCHALPEGQELISIEMMRALAAAGVVSLPPDWEKKVKESVEGHLRSVPAPAWADSYYKMAFEAGMNMKRVHRGVDLALMCLEFDPGHSRARDLLETIGPLAESSPGLTGD